MNKEVANGIEAGPLLQIPLTLQPLHNPRLGIPLERVTRALDIAFKGTRRASVTAKL